VLITGAGSLFRGSAERLQFELGASLPGAFKVKVVAAAPIERRFSAWIGASILASLGSFQQLWVSKKEYDEMGPARAVVERFS
jgi:actin-related protein